MIALYQPVVDGIPVPLHVAVTFDPMRYHVAVAGSDRYDTMDEKNLTRRLRTLGVSLRIPKGMDVSPVESCLLAYQTFNKADAFGRLSGHAAGLYEMGGKRFMVVDGATPTVARAGEWPTLRTFLDGLLGEGVQFDTLIGWLQQARRSLASEDALPGQVAAFAGSHGVGKSFLQSQVITPLLGGRQACPFDYMAGSCDFNSEMFEADHLAIEDKFYRYDMDTRRQFGTRLKELAVNSVQRCHGKGAKAVYLKPKWRVTMSLNPERENLNVLPPLDDAIKEKLLLFLCSCPVFPFGPADLTAKRAWGTAIHSELPAFAQFVDTFVIPAAVQHERYGVAAYHAPELLEGLEDNSPESLLLACIEHDLPGVLVTGATEWCGSSHDLERLLLGQAMPSREQVRRLFAWPGACGTYLGRLAKSPAATVTRRRVNGHSSWTIKLPVFEE